MSQVAIITPFSGYGKHMETSHSNRFLTCHAHDPEVALGKSLALEISALEKRNHDKILIKAGFATQE